VRIVGAGLALVLGLGSFSCKSNSRYYWGDYEDSVYNVTTNAGAVDTSAEIARITELIQRAADKGKPVPPGVHAHLGLLYSLAGDTANATSAFQAEKTLYPESTSFIDGVQARAQERN